MTAYPSPTITRLQQQIETDLMRFIRLNQLHAGDRLPPQKELAEQLQVSPAALREVLARLANQGLVRQAHGVGTFLSENPFVVHYSAQLNLSLTEMIRAQGMQPGTRHITLNEAPVPAEFADFLSLPPGATALCLTRIRTADEAPFALAIAYFAPHLRGLSTDPQAYTGSLYEYLEQTCHEAVTESEATIEAQVASADQAQALQIPQTSPLLAIIQRHRNQHGVALFASVESIVQKRLVLKVSRQRPGFSPYPAD